MQYTDQLENIVESIFISYFDFDIRNPDEPFHRWYRNKNARKKFKTLNLYVKQKGLCFHCDNPVEYIAHKDDPKKSSLDRILPGSYGGGYQLDNLVLSCLHCNKQRGDKLIEEYREWQQSN